MRSTLASGRKQVETGRADCGGLRSGTETLRGELCAGDRGEGDSSPDTGEVQGNQVALHRASAEQQDQ